MSLIRPARPALCLFAAATLLTQTALAQSPGPGVPMVPMAPGTPAPAALGIPGASAQGLGVPTGQETVTVAPDGSTTVSGVEIPQHLLNRINGLISGKGVTSANPLAGNADLRANHLTPETFANPTKKLESPTPKLPSVDQSTWYPAVQVPGMTSLTTGYGVEGASNVITMPAGVAAPGIPQAGTSAP